MLGNVVTERRLALSRLARNRLCSFWFADYHTAPLIIWICMYLNRKELVKLYACISCALRTIGLSLSLSLFDLFPIAVAIELNLAPKPFFFLMCILLFLNLIWKFGAKKNNKYPKWNTKRVKCCRRQRMFQLYRLYVFLFSFAKSRMSKYCIVADGHVRLQNL